MYSQFFFVFFFFARVHIFMSFCIQTYLFLLFCHVILETFHFIGRLLLPLHLEYLPLWRSRSFWWDADSGFWIWMKCRNTVHLTLPLRLVKLRLAGRFPQTSWRATSKQPSLLFLLIPYWTGYHFAKKKGEEHLEKSQHEIIIIKSTSPW